MDGLNLVVVGLTLSSSWGNGHATTYRALLRGLSARGSSVTFLEQEAPWYRDNRDLPSPEFATLEFYSDVCDLRSRFTGPVRNADAVLVGSFVSDGVKVIDWVLETATGPVVFYDIDTPLTLSRLKRNEESYLAQRQIRHFAAYLSFAGGPTLDVLRRSYGARRPYAFYCTVDADRYRPDKGNPAEWALGYLGTYSDDRQPSVQRLLLDTAAARRDAQFIVAGPQYPEEINWPRNVARVEHLPPAKHPSFYNAQSLTLNVTRADMIAAGWSPSVRLFEAAACATPVISDRWNGLDELFPIGEAVLVADTTDDVRDYLDMDETQRRGIGEMARDIVLEQHRAEVRAGQLEQILTNVRTG